MPRVASVFVIVFNFPAAKLLIQPPAIVTIAHLNIREPFGDDGDEGSRNTYARTCKLLPRMISLLVPRAESPEAYAPTRLTTIQLSAALNIRLRVVHNHRSVSSPRGPRCVEACSSRLLRILLFRSTTESCIQSSHKD